MFATRTYELIDHSVVFGRKIVSQQIAKVIQEVDGRVVFLKDILKTLVVFVGRNVHDAVLWNNVVFHGHRVEDIRGVLVDAPIFIQLGEIGPAKVHRMEDFFR